MGSYIIPKEKRDHEDRLNVWYGYGLSEEFQEGGIQLLVTRHKSRKFEPSSVFLENVLDTLKHDSGKHFHFEYAHEGLENFYLWLDAQHGLDSDVAERLARIQRDVGDILTEMERKHDRIIRPPTHREREQERQRPDKEHWSVGLAKMVSRMRERLDENVRLNDAARMRSMAPRSIG